MFVTDVAEKSRLVLDKIQEIEKKVSEIKEWNSLMVPAVVVQAFPVICNVNIFSFIKRIEGAKRSLVAKFKDVKNEIRYIEYKLTTSGAVSSKYSRRLEHLNDVKDKIKEELMHHRHAYCHIDQIFTREIRNAQQQPKSWFCFFWFYGGSAAAAASFSNNPVVDRFLVQQQQNFIVTLT
jgi:flagellar biosynthesis/type III secretory pathway chaperone